MSALDFGKKFARLRAEPTARDIEGELAEVRRDFSTRLDAVSESILNLKADRVSEDALLERISSLEVDREFAFSHIRQLRIDIGACQRKLGGRAE